MENEIVKPDQITEIRAEIAKTNLNDLVIADLAKEYLPLTITSLEDKDGALKVHQARMDVVRKRNLVEKKRKELKEAALEYGRLVDKEARRITDLLAPIETHLDSEEARIQAEKDAIAKAEADRLAALLAGRVQTLVNCSAIFDGLNYRLVGLSVSIDGLRTQSEAEFSETKAAFEKVYEEQAAARQAEQAERERVARVQAAEQERLATIQREQEATARAQREAQAEIAARERAVIEAEEARKQEAIRAEERRVKAEAERLAREQQNQRLVDAANRQRPDNERLMVIIGKLKSLIDMDYDLATPEGQETLSAIRDQFGRLINDFSQKLL